MPFAKIRRQVKLARRGKRKTLTTAARRRYKSRVAKMKTRIRKITDMLNRDLAARR